MPPSTPAVAAPPAAPPATPPAACALDSLSFDASFDASKAVQEGRGLLKRAGMTDADIDQLMAAARGKTSSALQSGRADLSRCASVRTNRKVGILQLVTLSASLVVMVLLALRGGSSRTLERALVSLSLTGAVLAAVQWRHALGLLFKVGWYGFGTTTRLQALLVAASLVATGTYALLKPRAGAPVLVSVLLVLAGIAGANIYFTARAVAKPESMALVAVMGAVNRALTADRISRTRALALGLTTAP